MATVSPSPDSPSLPATPPPPLPSTTPPPTQSSPPIAQPNANPPDPTTPSPPSPPPNTPPPVNSGTPGGTPPPVDSPPPPAPSAEPPTVPVTPPPTPSTGSPPPAPSVSSPPPPPATPPVNPPPPAVATPPSPTVNPPANTPPSPANPPVNSPPPPASSPPPTSPPSQPTTPPTSPPTPPSASPPDNPPPPTPVQNPPEGSPPPPASTPPENPPPPSPSSSQPPQSLPTPPAALPPDSQPPPSGESPPPSVADPASPPSTRPGAPPGLPLSPPSRGLVPSSPSVPGSGSSPGAPGTVNEVASNGGLGTGATVAIGVVAGLLILGLIGLIGLWIFKRKKKSSGPYDGHVIPASIGSSPRSDGKLLVKTEYPGSNFGGSGSDTPTDHGGFGHSRSWFTYHELYEATSGFSDDKLLGEGGFGRVHKGILSDGRVVAVKQLKVGGGQGEREFKAEVEIISRIHHRHLVSLVGYCILESNRLLVYEYVPNNTLHFHLHGKGRPVLDWATRVKIAVGAARGITYLHEDCHPRIIHRDIKSTNILLDNNYESRVADFGLAKLAMDAETHVSTRVMGTFGYMAPEYATSGKLTEKSDVYSFGVVLLELITGRKPVDESQPLGDESLVEWARPLLNRVLETGELEDLVDQRLEKNYIESEMLRMIEAAAACVRHSAIKRPRMGLVVRALSMSDSGDLSNGLRVGESQLYDSAQQSAEIRWFQRMAFGGSQDISSGDFFSNPSQSLGFSGQSRQNVDRPTQREHNRNSQNTGFPHQRGGNVNFSAERQSSQHNQVRNPSFYREDSVNRMTDL